MMVFDPLATGHHLEFILHLVRWCLDRPCSDRVVFVVHPAVAEKIGAIPAESNVEVVALQDDILSALSQQTPLKRAVAQWRVLQQHGRQLRPSKTVLMSLNPAHVFLAFGFLFRPRLGIVSGIFLAPYSRGALDAPRVSFGRLLQRIRKALLFKLMIQNPSVGRVFLLNDRKSVAFFQRKGSQKVRYLPDPVWPPAAVRKGNRSHDRKVFLFFGSISERKGFRETISAFSHISPESAARAALVFAGRPVFKFEEEVKEAIEVLREKRPELEVIAQLRFLEPGEVDDVFSQSDCILIPYRATDGSSGVIGHAIRAGKRVIGPASGLVGELIREYGAGVTIDVGNTAAFAQTIERFLSEEIPSLDAGARERFLAERSPDRFAQLVLGMAEHD